MKHKRGRDKRERHQSVLAFEGDLLTTTKCGVMVEFEKDVVDLTDGVLGSLRDIYIFVSHANLRKDVLENFVTLIVQLMPYRSVTKLIL